MRLHKLQVISRIPPASRGINGRSSGLKTTLDVVVLVEAGRLIDRGPGVCQMAGRAAPRLRNINRAITLVLVTRQGFGQGD